MGSVDNQLGTTATQLGMLTGIDPSFPSWQELVRGSLSSGHSMITLRTTVGGHPSVHTAQQVRRVIQCCSGMQPSKASHWCAKRVEIRTVSLHQRRCKVSSCDSLPTGK